MEKRIPQNNRRRTQNETKNALVIILILLYMTCIIKQYLNVKKNITCIGISFFYLHDSYNICCTIYAM